MRGQFLLVRTLSLTSYESGNTEPYTQQSDERTKKSSANRQHPYGREHWEAAVDI